MSLALFLAAQMAMSAPVCTAPVAPGGEFAGWASAATIAASAKTDSAATMPIGSRVDLTLVPNASVQPAVAPHQPAQANSYGGFAAFAVAKAGTYRVALAAPAWIEMLDSQNHAQRSVAHSHGPDCSPIKKIVDFPLTPGTYRLQVTGSFKPTLAAIVAAKP